MDRLKAELQRVLARSLGAEFKWRVAIDLTLGDLLTDGCLDRLNL